MCSELEVCLYQIYPPSIDTLVTEVAEDNDDCASFDEDSLCFFAVIMMMLSTFDVSHLTNDGKDALPRSAMSLPATRTTFKQKLEATRTTLNSSRN